VIVVGRVVELLMISRLFGLSSLGRLWKFVWVICLLLWVVISSWILLCVSPRALGGL